MIILYIYLYIYDVNHAQNAANIPMFGHLNDIRLTPRYCNQKGFEYVSYEKSQAICTL